MFIYLFFSLFIVYIKSFEQLAFSGGGAFGAVEIGILKKIHELEPTKQYDMYTGISAGGLNAGFLSFYEKIEDGIQSAETLYSDINNKMIYKATPKTGMSLLNTYPLRNTLTDIISSMKTSAVVHTLIGATNLETGILDIFTFENKPKREQVSILMSTSAIPVVFPPISYKNTLYADGGTLCNELLDIYHPINDYLNITYITPSYGSSNYSKPLENIKDVALRSLQIIINNYNDPLTEINQICDKPYGEINQYFVDPIHLNGYNMLNFNTGKQLVDIGYRNVEHKYYKLC